MNQLTVYKGYSIDYRLKQFRKVAFEKDGNPADIEFLDFDTERGDLLLAEMIEKDLVPQEILADLV